jgi:hypothetical protein
MDFPRILLVRQHFPDRSLSDIPGAVRSELHRASLGAGLQPGSSIAIGVGSRGIANIAVITRAVVDYWKSVGMKPFIFPAMGSHGAATAEGQARVLAHFGIRESSMECPIRSQLEVVPAGRTAEGIDTYIDRLAWESDGIMVVGRVKWHTDFEGEIESGLFKMMAIGLGKFAGAEKYHTHAYKLGLEHVILSVGRRILSTGKVLGGLAVLEDAYHQTAQVTAAGAEEMEQRERELLALTKSWMGRIPVAELDILVVDELGKNISGAGMDTKVVNRIGEGPANSWPLAPKIERIFVRGISELSYGSAVGMGMADVVTDRFVQGIDWTPTIVNALTASSFSTMRTPVHFAADRECLERLFPTVGKFDPLEVTLGWIRNTLALDRLALSENLRPEIERNPALEILGPPRELEFDEAGNLIELLAVRNGWEQLSPSPVAAGGGRRGA